MWKKRGFWLPLPISMKRKKNDTWRVLGGRCHF